ncbi:unnamed protein product [Parajaminaea phylloscopi]
MSPVVSPASETSSRHTSIHGPALTGWQFHQSHAQVTVVFYVSLEARDEDVQVFIASDHVIAGIRGFDPVLRAGLYARIDSAASSWQIEQRPELRRQHHHRRRRSRVNSQTRASPSHSGSAESEDAGAGLMQADLTSRTSSTSSLSSLASVPQRQHRNPTLDSSHGLPSPTARSTDSFELLHASSASLSSRGSHTRRSTGFASPTASARSDTFHHIERGSDAGGSSPRSRLHSNADADYLGATSPESPRSLSSRTSLPFSDLDESSGGLQSSVQFSATSSSGSQPSSGAAYGSLAARLVTIHLTKIDAGMWPSLISGPIPRDPPKSEEGPVGIPIRRRSARRSIESVSGFTATSDGPLSNSPGSALSSSTADGGSGFSDRTVGRLPAAESTTSFQSDESMTVLGQRRGSIDEEPANEARFDMDPVSLALVGLQLRGSTSSTSPTCAVDEAFEYFVRSWRRCELPVATEILVQDYLPLPSPRHQNPRERHTARRNGGGHEAQTGHRLRLVAGLGGPSALARLYVAYGRLSIASTGTAETSLSRVFLFPWGSGHCRDPYSAGQYGLHSTEAAHRRHSSPAGYASSGPSSPRVAGAELSGGEGQDDSMAQLSDAQRILYLDGPLLYLEEARRLDPAVQILACEWSEAHRIADQAALEVDAEMAADDGEDLFRGGEDASERGSTVFSAQGRHKAKGQEQARRRRGKKAGSGSKKAATSPTSTTDDGGLLAVLSGAALVSFVVAGSVAVLGWWRKGPGSTTAT